MKPWDAVIFDMDGTLFDTEMISRLAWLDVKEKYNLPVTEEFMLKLIGLTPANAQIVYDAYMPKGWPQEEAFQHHEDYIAWYRQTYGIPTKGDLHKLLSYVKNKGYRLALATSARHDNMMYNLKSSDTLQYFETVLSAEMMEKGKPDPDIYLKTMQALQVEPQRCIIIEDSFNGVKAAHASGADVVMIPDLREPTPEISRLCDYQLESLEDLFHLL